MRQLPFWLLIWLAFWSLACSGTQRPALSSLPYQARARQWKPQALRMQQASERLVFAPKGAYLAELAQGSYGLGTWVRFLPAGAWPQDEPRPSLILARVIERQADWARLELLAYSDGLRDFALEVSPYPLGETPMGRRLHALTKRLSFQHEQRQGGVALALRQSDKMTGDELYVAIDLSFDPRRRLAEQMTALYRVDSIDAEQSHLKLLAGQSAPDQAYVLLDAFRRPSFRVAIVIYAEAKDVEAQVLRRAILEGMKKGAFLGFEYIDVHLRAPKSEKAILQELGQARSQTLELALYRRDGRWQLRDQGLRLSLSAWRWIDDGLKRPVEESFLAERALVQALQMLGDRAGAIYWLEDLLKESRDPRAISAFVPYLAQLYHSVERDDWALELLLQMQAMAEHLSSEDQIYVKAALVSIASIIQRSEEFAPLYRELWTKFEKLAPDFQRQYYLALVHANWNKAQDWRRLGQEAMQNLQKNGQWREEDSLAHCLMQSLPSDAFCQDSLEQTASPFAQLWLRSLELLLDDAVEDFMPVVELLEQSDQLGAPVLSALLWARLSDWAQTPKGFELLQLNRAASQLKAQNLRAFLLEYRAESLQKLSQSVLNHGLQAEIIHWLSALDRRADLAALCVLQAQKAEHSPGEAIALLEHAAELYLSLGDGENRAISLLLMAKQYRRLGQQERSREAQVEALRFLPAVGEKPEYKVLLEALK